MKMHIFNQLYRWIFISLLGSSIILSFSNAASAQILEEITVTAQKREQSLQDVGISIAAFSGEQLEKMGVTNTVDIVYQVPGLQLFTYNPGNIYFNLRGVSQNTFLDSVEAPIAVYIDDAYMSSTNGLGQQAYDLERVEVLRGPQGTLFGRNATGGVIHYLTNAPDEEEFNGYFKAGFAEYDNYTFEGAVGGALSPTLRARVAGRWEKADGYTESIRPGVRDTNGKDGFSIRGALQWDASEDVLIDLRVSRTEDNDAPTGGYVVYPASPDPATGFGAEPEQSPITGDVHKHANYLEGGITRDVTSVIGKMTWQINDNLEFVSITSWTDIFKDYLEDAGGGFVPDFPYNPVAETEQITQEARLSGDYDRLRWQLGAYYMDVDIEGGDFVGGIFVTGVPDGRIANEWTMDSQNWSVFGQTEYDLTSELTFIGGLRFSQDDKSIDLINFTDGGGAEFGLFPGLDFPAGTIFLDTEADPTLAPDIDYGDFAVRLQLDWKPNEDFLAYASFNRGIKGGSYTLFITPVGRLRHDEEVLHAYEIGFKKSFPEAGMRLNASGFYYDYDDYQAFGLLEAFPVIVNRDAEIYGGEIELFWSPAEQLDLVAGLSLLESEITSVPNTFGTPPELQNTEVPSAPSVSINFLARYTWPAAAFGGGEFSLQIDGNYNDDHYLDVFNSAASEEKGYFLGNIRASYTTADENWKVEAFVKNFTDAEHRLYMLDLALGGLIESVYAPPQWIGGTISYSF